MKAPVTNRIFANSSPLIIGLVVVIAATSGCSDDPQQAPKSNITSTDAEAGDGKVGFGDGTASSSGGSDASTSSSGGTDAATSSSSGVTDAGGTSGTTSSSGGTDAGTSGASSSGGHDVSTSSSSSSGSGSGGGTDTATSSSGGTDAGTSSSSGGDATSSADGQSAPPGTCKDRCGKYVAGEKCQCDSGCKNYKDCCKDYEELCKKPAKDCKTKADCEDGNPCTTDGCIAGKCENPANTEACDDKNPCTVDDGCKAGKCGGAPKPCSDNDACTTDSCDPKAGCLHKPNTGPCTDGDKCLDGKTCKDGKCQGGKPKTCDDKNACTKDSCDKAAGCIHKPAEGQCDDGNACTTTDACKGGVCTGVKKNCDDGDACTDDLCDAKSAKCTNQAVGDGTPCDDANKCTDKDACTSGKCAGSKKSCDDGNACTADLCDGKTGSCDHSTSNNGGTCDDGNPCTEKDVCNGGKCKGVGQDCDDKKPCTVDTCDAKTKKCSHAPATEGSSCDDGDKCTVSAVCVKGKCEGKPKGCDDGNPCTKDGCSGTSGKCSHVSAASGSACDDGDACTSKDACTGGKCVGTKLCDDGNPCTNDSCNPQTGACSATPIKDGASCNDGDKCTTPDRCVTGKCVGTAKNCNDGEPCTTDSCNAATGLCKNDKLKDGATCNDGNACTAGETCAAGKCGKGKNVCSFKPLFTDNMACKDAGNWTATPATKEPDVGWHVDKTPAAVKPKTGDCTLNLNNGNNYDNGKRINASATSKTVKIPAVDHARMRIWTFHDVETSNLYDKRYIEISSDGFKQQVQSVQVNNSSSHKNKWIEMTLPMDGWIGRTIQVRARIDTADEKFNTGKGWFLDDMVIETGSKPGTCAGRCGKLDANASCQCDTNCAKAGNCCTDYKALCTGCQNDAVCNDGNPCTKDSCDKAKGMCTSVPVANSAACNDGDSCTEKDACLNGQCTGKTANCSDNEPCTYDFCDKLKGCQNNQSSGACEDGDKCTTKDTCKSGKCVSGPATCDDGNSCTKDACDAKTGKCTNTNLADGAACEDGNKCTSFDTCSAGKCIAGQPKCADGNACTTDACDAKTGACKYTPIKDGTPCDDGNQCTTGTACKAAKCVGKEICTFVALLGETFDCDKTKGWSMVPSNKEPETGWHVDATANPPGFKSAKCSLNFNNGKDFSNGKQPAKGHATSPVITLPAKGHARLSVWSYHAVEDHNGYDHRRVIISDDGFKTSVQSVKLDNSKNYNKWAKIEISLTHWLGKKVQVRFDFDSADEKFNTRAGWYLDDLLVEAGTIEEATSCVGRCGTFKAGAKCQCDAKCATLGTCCKDYKTVCTGCKADSDCNDGNACTADTCNKATGACSSAAAKDGTSCNDGNACTLKDTCAKGSCAGTKQTCADGNPCTFDSCDPLKGCVFPSNSASCDDGKPCTKQDFCNNGTCTGFGNKCDDGKPCTTDTCDAKTGACKYVNRPNGSACSTGDACFIGAKCNAGKCDGKQKNCDDGNQCTSDACDKKTGKCLNTVLKDGTACEDGNFCSANDTCQKGACEGKDICNYTKPMVWDFPCGKDSGVTIAPKPKAGEVGWAIDGTPNPPGFKSKSCSLNFNDGKDFQPAKAAIVKGTATTGSVTIPAVGHARLRLWTYNGVEKNNAYDHRTVEVSDDGFNKRVQVWKLDNNRDHGKWAERVWDLDGWLGRKIAVRFAFDSADNKVNNGKGWFVDDVAIEFGAVKPKNCKNDGNCNDGNKCTIDTCDKDGNCVNSTAKSDAECDDGEACTWDSCDKLKGCQHSDAVGGCDDGNKCTAKDTCKKGKCAGELKTCDDKNTCTADSCDPKTGGCVTKPKNEGALCSDGDICTKSDACKAGKCVGAASKCDDGKACTADSCDKKTGACKYTPIADGDACDDGDKCTADDKCAKGVCTGTAMCKAGASTTEAFNCGVKGWSIEPVIKAGEVGWGIDGTPNPPAFKSGKCSLNFNNGKNYDNGGTVKGTATSSVWSIPAGIGAELSFWSYNGVEDDTKYGNKYDNRFVDVSDDNFKSNIVSHRLSNGSNSKKWAVEKVRIDTFAGKKVRVRFRFDSGDKQFNTGTGWFVDDLKVYALIKK